MLAAVVEVDVVGKGVMEGAAVKGDEGCGGDGIVGEGGDVCKGALEGDVLEEFGEEAGVTEAAVGDEESTLGGIEVVGGVVVEDEGRELDIVVAKVIGASVEIHGMVRVVVVVDEELFLGEGDAGAIAMAFYYGSGLEGDIGEIGHIDIIAIEGKGGGMGDGAGADVVGGEEVGDEGETFGNDDRFVFARGGIGIVAGGGGFPLLVGDDGDGCEAAEGDVF